MRVFSRKIESHPRFLGFVLGIVIGFVDARFREQLFTAQDQCRTPGSGLVVIIWVLYVQDICSCCIFHVILSDLRFVVGYYVFILRKFNLALDPYEIILKIKVHLSFTED